MSNLITPDKIRDASSVCEGLGLEAGSFGRFVAARNKALSDRQQEHEVLMQESLDAEMAWAE